MEARMKKSLKMSAIAVAVSMGLAGCLGSGGGGGGAAAPTLAGQVAGGDVVKDATVFVCGAAGGCKKGTSNKEGSYSVDVTGLTAPYVVRAEFEAGGVTKYLYSIATGTGTANVTPASTLATVVAMANAGANITTVTFAESTTSTVPNLTNVTSTVVSAAVATVVEKYFKPIVDAYYPGQTLSVNDILGGTITPTVSLIDKVIAQVKVEITGGNVVLEVGGTQVLSSSATNSGTLTTAVSGTTFTSSVAKNIPQWDETGLVGTSSFVSWLEAVFQKGGTTGAISDRIVCAASGVGVTGVSGLLFAPCDVSSVTINPALTIKGMSATGADVTLGSMIASAVTSTASTTSGTSVITGRKISLLWTKGSTTGRIGMTVVKPSAEATTWKIKGFQQL